MSRPVEKSLFEIRRQFVTVDNTRVSYLLTGSGPAVLLVHGFGEFIETWAYNINALSKNFTVCVLDLPGHGMSGQPRQDYNLDYSMNFIMHFMEAVGLEHPSLLGRSMGGAICFSLAAEYPDIPEKVILVSSGGFNNRVPLPYRLAALPVLGDLFLGPPALVSETTVRLAMRRQFYNPDSIPDEWIRTACNYFRMPYRNTMIRNIVRTNASLTSSKPKVDIFYKLPQLKNPTLVLHGMQDNLVPVEQAKAASNMIPEAVLKILDECGHNPQIEKAREFNQAVISFLNGD